MYCAFQGDEADPVADVSQAWKEHDAMRSSQLAVTGVAAALSLVGALAGCGSKPAPAPSGSATSSASSTSSAPPSPSPSPAQPTDYTGLLIQATDINAPIAFTASPPTNNPNGQPGVATTFSAQDGNHVIKDTIQVLADPGAAANALNAAKAGQGAALAHPTTDASKIGANGVVLTGNSSDKSKGIAILLFTEGKAFVTLEFDGPADSLPPEDFVNDVGGKQDAAVQKGLGG
ncbi:hypothetical protein MSG_02520 [Mycobacterium shigaense]|uniref:Uncharacterized protein n=2 Tax=Mycobacterium shigaense TaxID=722731 RepID=A0A1Z4EI75_9MYCO|nr:hypothetical protein MSG_02520 [Mycobacterium shigaense]